MPRAKVTLEQVAALEGPAVPVQMAAALFGVSAKAMTKAGKAGTLGLPFFFTGNRLMISKLAILDYCGYKGGVEHDA